jgi:hypothetical protein
MDLAGAPPGVIISDHPKLKGEFQEDRLELFFIPDEVIELGAL